MSNWGPDDEAKHPRDKQGQWADKVSGRIAASRGQMHNEDQLRAAFTFTDPQTGWRSEVDQIASAGEKNPDINEVYRKHPVVPPGRTMVTIKIYDADGKKIGDAVRTIHPPSQARVNHNSLVIDEGQRGQGFATRFNAHAEAVYRANGIRMVTLHANIDVGGYAWARAGFDFRNNSTRRATAAKAYVDSIMRHDPPEIVARFRELYDSGSGTAAPIDIAMVGYTPGATTWPGKELMLEADWQGVKIL